MINNQDPVAEDKEFRLVARELTNQRFVSRLSDAELSLITRLHDGTLPRRNLYPLNQSWVVKLYLGGKQRVLAIYPDSQFSDAVRLADMAIWYFWDLRRNGRVPPTDDHLNLSFNRAKLDRENEDSFLSSLVRLRTILPDRKVPRHTGSRRSVSDVVSDHLKAIESVLQVINSRLSRLETQLGKQLEKQIPNNSSQMTNTVLPSLRDEPKI